MKHKDPKEYAKELLEKYYQVQEKPEWGNDELRKEAEITYANNFVEFEKYYRGLAVECALIDVQNTIDASPCCEDSDRGGNLMYVNNSYYFEQVKTEINNLK